MLSAKRAKGTKDKWDIFKDGKYVVTVTALSAHHAIEVYNARYA